MSEQVTPEKHDIYHIFLASPGDMNDERQMVREFFQKYNQNYAKQHNLQFDVIDWENCSNIGVGRPQELITEQTLNKYRKSLVLVVGLLGQRFGTPTDIYDSGAEEEFATVVRFRQEQKDWPEIKWFFREKWGNQGQPEDPDELMEACQQWKKVKEFGKKMAQEDSELQLYTKDFPTTDDFAEMFRQDLERWLNDPEREWNNKHTSQTVQLIPEPSTQESPYLKIWFRLLRDECAHLPLERLDASQAQEQANPINLPDIFVPLKAIAPTKAWQETPELNLLLANEMAAGKQDNNEPVEVMELLQQHRLAVIIGDPGSGKSALINQLTWSLLTENTQNSLVDNLQGRIPLRIILRHVDIPDQAQQGQVSWLWDAVEKEIKETLNKIQEPQSGQQAKAVLASLKQKLIQTPGGLILLDGLDEVPEANNHRIRLLQAIQDLVASLPEQTRFIITARPYAYTDPRWRLADFSEFFLTPFDKDQREQFIHGWYKAAQSRLQLRDKELKQRIPDLLAQVENQRHLCELAERPLLLTLISIIHVNGGSLPDDRAQLYKDSINLLLHKWRQEPYRQSDGQALCLNNNELISCLQTLAYNVHQAQSKQHDSSHTADITRKAIETAFDPVLDELGRKDLFAFLGQHTGILIAREHNHFAFPHRSFQEYLAMGWLTAQTEDALSPEVCTDPLWWREVFLLAVIEQKKTPRNAVHYISDLLECAIDHSAESQTRLWILCGLALIELNLKGTDKLTRMVRDGLVNIIQDSEVLNISERAEAGRVLGRIGDVRAGVELTDNGLPDIAWVRIPEGSITLEDNAGTFPVEPFYLARYPVTNAQFQCFLDDPEGYANPGWWQEVDEQANTPDTPRWTEANHPRETVSWFEAMAFCAWLSDRLGKSISLPTEWQWQQAACSGQKDFDYPWGEKYKSGYANIDETVVDSGTHYLQRTTAVGLYPQGDSKQGVAELSGNIFEWCLNCYDDPKNTEPSGTFRRVVRGGSWIYARDYARASYRFSLSPDGRGSNIGFRVCCVSPI